MSAEVPLHIEIEGDGPIVALAHGFGGSARNFRPQARALAGAYRVVRYDARGHARSGAPADPAAYTPEAFVADLGRALDAAGPEPAVVGGLSMGAATALRFALARPECVRGLVLAGFPPGARDSAGFGAAALRFAEAIERDGLERAGEEFVWGPRARLGVRGGWLVRQGFLEHPPHGLAHTLRGLLAVQPPVEDLADALAQLTQPVLVVVGARDRMSLPPSQALVRALPQAELVVIEGGGHLVNLERPPDFNAALLEFLART